MAVRAYIIIDCSVDPADVVQEIASVPGIRQAHALFGDIDAIAFIEAPDLRGLDDIINSLYDIEGVEGTETHIARET